MSVYAKAVLFAIARFVFVIIIIGASFYLSREQALTILGPAAVVSFIAANFFILRVLTCPKCSTSVFRWSSTREQMFFFGPWPRRLCAECGNDLTRQ
jgi:hypothetical protein